MFKDTKVQVLSAELNPLSSFYADFQSYKGSITFDYGVTLEISKWLFCDKFKNFDEDIYLLINKKLYKPLYIKEWSDYLEIYLYKCRRYNG